MKKQVLFNIAALPYRDPIPVYGMRFGGEEKTLAVMGALRGDEHQQMYIAALLVKRLRALEEEGKLAPGCGVLVIPTAGQFSMNVGTRFWPVDDTDINRMFPGYDQGETTQRVADAVFQALRGYKYGVHLTSFYLPGDFMTHARIIRTGYENPENGLAFGVPYLVMRSPRPYDTTTLNYNWQVFDTEAVSLYTRATDTIDDDSAQYAVEAIIRFMVNKGILIDTDVLPGVETRMVNEESMAVILTKQAGIFRPRLQPGAKVREGEVLGYILDPYCAEVLEEIRTPVDGELFFVRSVQVISEHDVAFRVAKDET